MFILANLDELDGKWAKSGHPVRFPYLPISLMLNFVLADLLEGHDMEGRQRVQALLRGRIGEGGGIIVDDPTLPAELQGKEAPSWWDADYDPWSKTETLAPGTKMR